MDRLDKIYKISEHLTTRFGESSSFMVITRLAEEVGELAEQVNHFESVGIKTRKLGDPNVEHFANEAQDVIRVVLQLIQRYKIKDEFYNSIDEAFRKHFPQ